MKTNEIKKGMKIKSVQLGTPVTGIMMDNMKGNTRLVVDFFFLLNFLRTKDGG